jgi:hypothetical protein
MNILSAKRLLIMFNFIIKYLNKRNWKKILNDLNNFCIFKSKENIYNIISIIRNKVPFLPPPNISSNYYTYTVLEWNFYKTNSSKRHSFYITFKGNNILFQTCHNGQFGKENIIYLKGYESNKFIRNLKLFQKIYLSNTTRLY